MTARTQALREIRFLAGLVSLGVLLTLALLLAGTLLSAVLLGWRSTVVLSDSMAPSIRAGDVVMFSAPPARLSNGTVVLFPDPVRQGELLHRIVAVQPGGALVTKGDANASADSGVLDSADVRGVGRLVVPYVALPIAAARNGQWTRLAVAVAALAWLLYSVRWGVSSRYEPWTNQRVQPVDSIGWDQRAAVLLLGVVLLAGGVASAPRAAAAFVDQSADPANTLAADMLNPPTGLAASSGTTAGSVDLSWTATVDMYASGYRVFRGTSLGGPYSEIAVVMPQSSTTYQDTGLIQGTTYYYVLGSTFNNWDGLSSNEANGQPPGILNLQANDN